MASRLTNMTYGGQQSAGDIVYNASDQTTSIKIGTAGTNQVTENYTFDQQTGLLTNQKAIRNGSNLLDLSYEYNRGGSVGSLNGKTGHLTKIINNLDPNKNREYEFDAVGRLKSSWGGPNKSLSVQAYAYDRYGNRTSVYVNGIAADGSLMPRDGIANLTYNTANNRITTAGFEYDSAGNQTRALAEDGVTWVKYEYDSANRLRLVKKDDVPQTPLQSFLYGSTNARLFSLDHLTNQWTLYASNGGTVLSEYTEFTLNVPTWTKSYTYLGSSQLATITPNGSGGEYTEYNHPDRLGTRVITNQQTGGNSEQTTLPFGTALNAESTGSSNKRFTSYDRSVKTGLDYAINRTYDSKQGRFTQFDPIGMSASDLVNPQTLNLYSYCGNDPINYVDPSGLFFGSLFRWIGRIFNAVMRILKWVVITVVVVVIIVAIVSLPAAQALIGVIGTILGKISSFLALTVVTTEGTIGVGIGAKIAAGLFGVGALASKFAGQCPDPPDCTGSITLPEETVTVLAAGGFKLLSSIARALGPIFTWLGKQGSRFLNWLKGLPGRILEGIKSAARWTKDLAKDAWRRLKGDPKITFKTGHASRTDHFPNGVDTAQVESAITQNINQIVRNTSGTGEFWGRVTLNGTVIRYHAYTLPNRTISVGTYYPLP